MFQAYPSCAEFHQGSQGSEISRGWELPEQEAEGEEGEEGGARCYPLLQLVLSGSEWVHSRQVVRQKGSPRNGSIQTFQMATILSSLDT